MKVVTIMNREMVSMRNLKISAKLLLGFGTVLLVFALAVLPGNTLFRLNI